MEFASLVKQAAETLNATIEPSDEGFYLTVPLPPDEEHEGEERSELIFVAHDSEAEILWIADDVGPYIEESVDLPEMLRVVHEANFARVSLSERDEDDVETVIVEARVPVENLSAAFLSQVISEVADVSDAVSLFMYLDEDDVE